MNLGRRARPVLTGALLLAVSGVLPASAVAAPRDASVERACTPAFDTGVADEPWRGADRPRSERVYKAHMADEHPAYVRGRDGWKIFSDRYDDNFSQALGRKTMSPRKRAAWATWIRRSQRVVDRAGGRFYVVVAPATWDIYPHKLPRWAQRLRGSTTLQTLMSEHPNLPWVDTRAALREAARQHDTYEPLNSHWTPYGGYVAWAAVARCLRASAPKFGRIGVPPITGVGVGTAANEFAGYGVPDGRPRSTYPVYASPHPATTMTHLPDGAPLENTPDHVTDTLWGPVRTETPAAQAPDLTLLTLRDSTGSALAPLWSTSFGTTVQYAHGINQMGFSPPDLGELVATHRPDLVLLVITERWVSGRPPG